MSTAVTRPQTPFARSNPLARLASFRLILGIWRGGNLLAVPVENHLALARTLLFHGAFDEARENLREVEASMERTSGSPRLEGSRSEIAYDELTKTVATLRLEVSLLTRTPVVLESHAEAVTLRRDLTHDLESILASADEMDGSVANPLDIGIRSQFLLSYQVYGPRDTWQVVAPGLHPVGTQR